MTPPRFARRRVVVCDDDALASQIEAIVEEHGAVARCTPAEAVDLSGHGDVELAVVSVRDEAARGLVVRLRDAAPDTQLVVVTPASAVEATVRAVRHGVFAYLIEPLDPTASAAAIERALALAALRRERDDLARELAASEAEHRGVVESIEAFIIRIDAHGRVAFCNGFTSRTSGWAPERAHGLAFLELCVQGDERARVAAALARAADGVAIRGCEATLRTRLGVDRLVRWSFAPVPGRHEVVAVGVDVTDQSALERRAAEQEAMAALGALTTGLAHEIRNPLNSASLQLEVLARRARRLETDAGGEGLSDRVAVVQEQLARVSGTLSDFLDLARPRGIDHARVSVADVVERALERLEPVATAAAVTLDVDPALDALEVSGDRDKLAQVLIQLVGNAIEASRDGGGRVQIAASAGPDGFVTFTVLDDGAGLSPAVAADPFAPFVTTKAAGTGLGLTVVERIVRLHGGTVSIAPHAGGGTAARFTAPVPG